MREERTHILIVCGGLQTEPRYFRGLQEAGSCRPDICFTICKKAESPDRLVAYAAIKRDQAPDVYDEVWCVTDVDEFEMAGAISRAEREDILLAVSNPCFELWLLHIFFSDCRAHLRGCREVLCKLRAYISAYDKNEIRILDFAPGIVAAVKRGQRLAPAGEEHLRNPSTGVWKLVQKIVGG
ncbi:RloB family protein [Fodinicola feengrottensis]|uniref:RloB family protein n=1 Tax=Fodinicola feengrottensis TaxID=435914 RepID=UPI0013D47C77|nr:RloB family protein [Fodinicola feengrottensis]